MVLQEWLFMCVFFSSPLLSVFMQFLGRFSSRGWGSNGDGRRTGAQTQGHLQHLHVSLVNTLLVKGSCIAKPKVWGWGNSLCPSWGWGKEREHQVGISIQSTQILPQYWAFWVIEYMHASFHLQTTRLFSRAAALATRNSQGWASPYILTHAQNCPTLISASLMDVKWHRNDVSLMTFASKHLFTSC